MKSLMRGFFVLAVAAIAPLSVFAQQGGWGAKAEEKAKARQEAKAQAPVQHRDWRAVHHHDPNGDPRGWEHGQKVGWNGRGVPPGQLKEVNERHHHRRHHDHDWKRDHERFRHSGDRDHERFHHHREHDRDRH